MVPPWIETATAYIGLKEYSGSGDNPVIIRWAQIIGGWVADYYKRDSIPWCGLFTGICMLQNSIQPPKEMLRAKAWYYNWSDGYKLKEPCFGCVIVFTRNGGGHVGFYISEDANYFHVLGGNQSDAVNIKKISKSRVVGYMWPKGEQWEKFKTPGRVRKAFSGKVSTNEA
jgi:uncharacterized protein (TIGR02594 family)